MRNHFHLASETSNANPVAGMHRLSEVKDTFESFSKDWAKAELTNWGGWWRNRHRENRDKADRVLAEVRSMIREGLIQTNPGATATDLWNRLP